MNTETQKELQPAALFECRRSVDTNLLQKRGQNQGYVNYMTMGSVLFFCSSKSDIMSYDDGLQITKEGDNVDVLQVLYRGNN